MEKKTNNKTDWKTENCLTALVYMAQQQYWQSIYEISLQEISVDLIHFADYVDHDFWSLDSQKETMLMTLSRQNIKAIAGLPSGIAYI